MQKNIDNPVLPWDDAEGSFLGPFLDATDLRSRFIQAQRVAVETEERLNIAIKRRNELKAKVEASNSAQELRAARHSLGIYEKQERAIRKDFLDRIREVNLLAPEDLFEEQE